MNIAKIMHAKKMPNSGQAIQADKSLALLAMVVKKIKIRETIMIIEEASSTSFFFGFSSCLFSFWYSCFSSSILDKGLYINKLFSHNFVPLGMAELIIFST